MMEYLSVELFALMEYLRSISASLHTTTRRLMPSQLILDFLVDDVEVNIFECIKSNSIDIFIHCSFLLCEYAL